MAWDHDKMPIEYLAQRVKYYKKRKAMFSTIEKINNILINEIDEETFNTVHANLDIKIKLFEDAIICLTENGF